jgi:hypothetical protein
MKEISMVVQANKISYYGISDIYITKTSKIHIDATHIKNVCNVNVRDIMEEISMVVQANKISYHGISDIYITRQAKYI